jgi:hypothetical protein
MTDLPADLQIRPVEADDADALHALRQMPSILAQNPPLPGAPREVTRESIENLPPTTLKIVATVGATLVGEADLQLGRNRARIGRRWASACTTPGRVAASARTVSTLWLRRGRDHALRFDSRRGTRRRIAYGAADGCSGAVDARNLTAASIEDDRFFTSGSARKRQRPSCRPPAFL